MTKKYLLLIVMLLGLVVFAAGCNTRDLSKPSTRIVGHWAYTSEGEPEIFIESYIGETNEEGVGSFITAGASKIFYDKYRVLFEDRNMVTISVFNEIIPSPLTHEIIVAKDGQTLEYMVTAGLKYQYIDSKSEP